MPESRGPVPGQALEPKATRITDRGQASLSSCLLTQPVPWFILCLFLETGWVLTLPPYHPTSIRQDSYLSIFLFSSRGTGCSPAVIQSFQEPEFDLLRCVPQRIVLSPSWAFLLIRVDCKLKPPLLRAVYGSPPGTAACHLGTQCGACSRCHHWMVAARAKQGRVPAYLPGRTNTHNPRSKWQCALVLFGVQP